MEAKKTDRISTRQRILQFACEVFAHKGFRNTTIRDISERARVNVAAVNYYFGSKENLYEAVCKYVCGLSVEQTDPRFSLADGLTPEEKLKTFIQTLLFTVLGKCQSDLMEMIMGREMIEPTKALTIVIEDMIKPRFQQLYALVKELLGDKADDETVCRYCLSITGQCLYYRFAQPVARRLNPRQQFDQEGIENLADHIAKFSLSAIKQYALNS